RFSAHFGMSLLSAGDLWLWVEQYFEEDQLVKDHMLWGLHYLKVYPTDSVAAAKFGVSETTWRVKVQLVVDIFVHIDT
ncbi:hypothetical protein HDU99_002358, partial [Rhizoclosmatium hyalinum]